MKALVENWHYSKESQKVLNWYLLRILDCIDTESLHHQIADLESELHRKKIKNPFTSGFTEDGFGVYHSSSEQRMIFVECETDIEL